MAASETINLLPYLAVTLPEMGIPKKDPMGRKNNKPPKAPSLNPNCIFISGIRLAQLAKQMPVRKKYPDRTIRLKLGEIVLALIAQRWGFSRNWVIFADLSYFNSSICIVHTIAAP